MIEGQEDEPVNTPYHRTTSVVPVRGRDAELETLTSLVAGSPEAVVQLDHIAANNCISVDSGFSLNNDLDLLCAVFQYFWTNELG